MFDVSWSELLILGLVTLIFVGPKELPRFLGTLGRYAGIVRRQANEFRAVFDQAMREAEMDQLKKEVQAVSDGVKSSLNDAARSVNEIKAATKVEADALPQPASPKAEGEAAATPALTVAGESAGPASPPSGEVATGAESEAGRPADASLDSTSRPV
jgi:sec-independent protein translocase protein TatB